MKNLNQLLRFLLENELEFVLVGGLAGVIHGSAQVTQDLDICLLTEAEKIKDLRRIPMGRAKDQAALIELMTTKKKFK